MSSGNHKQRKKNSAAKKNATPTTLQPTDNGRKGSMLVVLIALAIVMLISEFLPDLLNGGQAAGEEAASGSTSISQSADAG